MNNKLSLLLLSFFFFFQGFSQSENFVYCFGSDTIFVEKIAEVSSGDTVIKSYQYAFNNIDPGFFYEFDYYLYNDSIFSKYNGNYYLVGDNNAQVGDIWQPLHYMPFFDADSAEYDCTGLKNMEVSSITQVDINGTPTNYFHLIDIDNVTGESEDYAFLAGAGATVGGPLYNFIQLYPCIYFSDGPPNTLFKSYSVSNFTYQEVSECPYIDGIGVDEINKSSAKISKNGSYLKIENASLGFSVKIIDLLGREVVMSYENTIDISHLKGIYFVRLKNANNDEIVKMYF